MEKINLFFDFLLNKKIDLYLLSNYSEFELDSYPEFSKRIEFLCDFESSNAFLLFHSKTKTLLLITDRRYELAGKIHFNKEILKEKYGINFEIFLINTQDQLLFFKEQLKIESRYLNKKCIQNIFDNNQEIKEIKEEIFEDFIKFHNFSRLNDKNLSNAFIYEEKYSGESSSEKLQKIFKHFQGNNIDFYLFSNPISVCWLLNLRGNDIKFTPIFLCFLILDIKNEKIEIYCEKPEFLDPKIIKYKNFSIQNLEAFYEKLKTLKNLSMNSEASIFLQAFKDENLDFFDDPVPLMMSIKNQTEINGSKKAHLSDGIALTKLWLLFENQENFPENEISISEKLFDLKKESAEKLGIIFFEESFETISGFEENSAIIHYHPEKEKQIKNNGLLLLDSGAQYFGGTTDITRIFLLKKHKPTIEQIRNYTICLKAHLSLFLKKFKKETEFSEISQEPIKILENYRLSCPHSIGHGVSNFLSVHERPFSINKISTQKLVPGIIVSNEPGIYFENKYGIRIENLMLSEFSGNNQEIKFANLTQFFYEPRLIDVGLLNQEEMNFIKKTHQEIFNALEKYFNDDEKKQIYENFIKTFNQKLYNFEDLERDLKNNGYNFIFFENINSTHLKMLDLINSHHKSENLHRLIILAKSQSSGKGKGSNLWSSDDGGIYLNIAYNFCQTKIPRKYFSQISLIAGLVISDILEKNLSYKLNNIQIKWPNDILINEKKICGILPEIILDYLVIGIGINFFPNQNILCDEQRGYISNLVFIEFHKLIFEIIIELNKILYEFFESENFIENFLQTQILPKVEKKLKKQTRFGLISKLLPDGSIDVFDENDNKTIKNFKSALDFENAEKNHL